MNAVSHRDIELVQEYIDDASVNVNYALPYPDGRNALWVACEVGMDKIVNMLLQDPRYV